MSCPVVPLEGSGGGWGGAVVVVPGGGWGAVVVVPGGGGGLSGKGKRERGRACKCDSSDTCNWLLSSLNDSDIYNNAYNSLVSSGRDLPPRYFARTGQFRKRLATSVFCSHWSVQEETCHLGVLLALVSSGRDLPPRCFARTGQFRKRLATSVFCSHWSV